mgnify:CR=1 FL=1
MGRWGQLLLLELIARAHGTVHAVYPIIYGAGRPCWLTLCSWGESPIYCPSMASFEGKHDKDMPGIALDVHGIRGGMVYGGEWYTVGDPCVGLGTTARHAMTRGCPFMGMDIEAA